MAIASLSIEEQQLVRWRLFQFTTYREMAQRLGVTEHTARRRCEAALGALRRAWADGDFGSS
jgi:DNA-directed RNA polymerase specialized sigma24 family protein